MYLKELKKFYSSVFYVRRRQNARKRKIIAEGAAKVRMRHAFYTNACSFNMVPGSYHYYLIEACPSG